MTSLNRIKKLLAQLKKKDPELRLFGAKGHKYVSRRYTEDEIQQFEKKYDILLPADFRQFLLEIGHGAGPGYGILSFDESIEAWEQNDRSFDLSKSFPFSNQDVRSIYGEHPIPRQFEPDLNPIPCDGALAICYMGCTYYYVLVITGEQRGKIWYVNNMYVGKGHWYPTSPKRHQTFIEWYRTWLEHALKEVDELY